MENQPSQPTSSDAPLPNLSSPEDFFQQQRQAGALRGMQDADANPDDAARALELSKVTGVPAPIIHDNLEDFEAEHRRKLTADIIKNNSYLADYANSDPMAAKVSANDWGQLHTISESISNLTGEERANLFRGRIHDILPTEQQTPEPNRPSPAELMKQWEGKPALNSITGSRDIGDYLNHYINNVVGALGESSQESAEQVTDPKRPGFEQAIAAAVAVPKAIAATGFAMMQPINDAFQAIGDTIERLSGGHIWSQDVQTALMMPGILGLGERVGDLKFGKALKDHVEAINLAAPHILEGKLPPVGLNDLLDSAHKELAKQDIKNLDDVVKEVQKSQTKEIAPDLFEKNFLSQRTDATVSVSAEAIKKLYGDKIPEPDDNILGFVPHLAEQIAGAEQFGGRVEIPLSTWIAKVDPDVFKALHDDIAFRRGGMTINETKPPEVAEGAEKPQPKSAPIDSIDAIRRPAGLDPVAAPQLTLSYEGPVTDDPILGKDTHRYNILDTNGNEAGNIQVFGAKDAESIHLNWVGSAEGSLTKAGGTPNIFGTGQMLRIFRQLAVEFPNAKEVTAYRVSGARAGTPAREQTIRIPLRPTSSQLTDFMRSGFEAQTVADFSGKIHDVQPIYSTTVGASIPPESIAKVTDSPIMRAFGEKIHALTKDVPIHVISRKDINSIFGRDVDGFHQLLEDGTSSIFLPDDIGTWKPEEVLHTVMHEASHAATIGAIESYPEIKTKIRSLMNEVNGHLTTNDFAARKAHDYAFTNEKEFVAEGQSKESFQEALKNIPISKELWKDLGSQPANAWEALKNIVKELWERLTGKEVPQNALDALFKLSEEIETAQKEVIGRGKVGTDFAPPKETQLELLGLTRVEDREAFEKAAAIGMTVKQFRQYQELIEKRDVQDMDHFRAQAERRERQRQTAEWKAEENRAREEAKTNLQGRPDIAADNLLRDGTYLGEKLKGRVRLDSDKLTAEQKAGLPEDYLKSGGINPDDAATMFGYHNPDAMLGAIKQLHADRGELGPKEHINKLAEKITQDHMTREFGNLEQNILEEAKDHVISPTQLDILHEELVALGSKFGGELSIKKADIKVWVKKQFAEMPISMHRVDDYLAAAGRAGRGAEQALLDEDPREAFKFKQQQYVSMQMANEAKAYEKARASFDKLAKRLAKREITGLPQDYVAQIRDQLLRAQLPIGRSVQSLGEDVAKAGDLMQFVKRASEESQIPILLPDWMYSQWGKKLDTMTAGEFSEYSKGIKQLYNFGQDEQKIIIGGEKIEHAKFMEQAKNQLEVQSFNKKPVPYNPSKTGELVGKANNIFYGGLIQAESIFNRWDLGDKRGFFLTNFMYPAARAVNDLSARIKVYARQIQQAAKPIDGLKMKQGLPGLLQLPSNGQHVNMIVENALRMIMDMGNSSNKGKFIEGWKVDPQALDAWLKANTTKEMWDFAQNLGDVHEKMFSDLKDMIDSVGGVSPDRVEIQPFIDPHGVQRRGWYSPMLYDQVELGKSRKLARLPVVDPNDVTGLTDTGYFKSTTATGAEIQRTGYAAPTDLTLDRIPQKMGQILYDTAMRPTVINLNKAFRDTDFLNAIKNYSGVETRNLMRSWFRDIVGAGKGVSSESDAAMNQIGEFLRRNIVAQLVGWNLHTAQKHGLSALATSMAEVGVKNFAREFIGLVKASPDSMKNGWNYTHDMSEEVQRRDQHFVDSLGGQVESIKMGGPSWRDMILEKGSMIVSFADALSARASWSAEFKTQLAEEAKLHPDKTPDEYIGTARDIADSIVRRAHGSTALTSRPGFMRSGNSLTKSFVSLYGFFNQMLQRNYEATWRTKYAVENFKAGDKEKGWENLRRAGVLYATSALWPALVEEMVTPYTNSDHDSWGKWTAKTLLNGMSSTIPFVREFVHAWLNNFEVGGGIFDSGMHELKTTSDDLTHGARMMDAEHGGKTIKALTSIVGMATGLPNEVGNVMKTAWDSMHRSKETPKNVAETFRDVTTGKAVGQPDIIQRAVIEPFGQKGRRK